MIDHLRMKGKDLRVKIDLFWSAEDECYIAVVTDSQPETVHGISAFGDEPRYALYELSIALTTALEVVND